MRMPRNPYPSRMEAFGAFHKFWRGGLLVFLCGYLLALGLNYIHPSFDGRALDEILVIGIATWVVGALLGFYLDERLCRHEEKRIEDAVEILTNRLADVVERHIQEIDDTINRDRTCLDGLSDFQRDLVLSRLVRRL